MDANDLVTRCQISTLKINLFLGVKHLNTLLILSIFKSERKFKNMADLRQKLKGLYSVVDERFYVGRSAREFNGANPALLLSFLTGVTNGRQLTFGNWGMGKTTLSETLEAVLYSTPLQVVLSTEAHGDPEVTKEEFIASPDLADLKSVLWKRFVQNPVKKFDEFNRMPSQKQSLFFDGIDRGNFEYQGITLFSKPGPFFATCNWPDRGNSEILPPTEDRFDIAVCSEEPDLLLRRHIMLNKERKIDYNILKDESNDWKDMLATLDGNEDYDKKMVKLSEQRSSFRNRLEKTLGVELLTDEEIKSITKQINSVEISQESWSLIDMIHAEATCPFCGEKLPNKGSCNSGCHYAKANGGSQNDYMFVNTTRPLTIRFDDSLSKYSKALSWYSGSNVVHPSAILLMLPYLLWHRAGFRDDFGSNDPYTGPLQVYRAKLIAGGLQQRFNSDKALFMEAYNSFISNEKPKMGWFSNNRDHPLFKHYEKKMQE